jgi:hypothetical protein
MSGTEGARPAAATAGRHYWATDENILYRDDGSSWIKVGTLDLADLTERNYASLQSRSHGNDDHTTGVAPANVTKAAAAEGASAAVARADHKHDVTTATPVTQALGDSAAEGTATSLARSDHRHGMPAETDKVFRWTQTFAIQGEIKVPSGDTDFIPPFFVSLASGETLKLVKARYLINSGTSVTAKLQKNGSDITGFTGISVTTTAAETDPTNVDLADNDRLALVVTAVSGTPKNLSFSLVFEATP